MSLGQSLGVERLEIIKFIKHAYETIFCLIIRDTFIFFTQAQRATSLLFVQFETFLVDKLLVSSFLV